jgi:hypothetical protein
MDPQQQPRLAPDFAAVERGRAEGEAFDQRLRQGEASLLLQRLQELQGLDNREGDDLITAWQQEGPGAGEEAAELREYLDAVRRSRAWRLAQALRGLVGRRW